MGYKLPKSINKSELKRDVVAWEKKKFKEPKYTLSQTLDDQCFVQAWDTSKLSAAEMALIHAKFAKSPNVLLMLVQLKK